MMICLIPMGFLLGDELRRMSVIRGDGLILEIPPAPEENSVRRDQDEGAPVPGVGVAAAVKRSTDIGRRKDGT